METEELEGYVSQFDIGVIQEGDEEKIEEVFNEMTEKIVNLKQKNKDLKKQISNMERELSRLDEAMGKVKGGNRY